VLRGANDYMLDEIDRSLHDALCVVKRVLESNAVVPGGGCVEAALSIYMEHYADTMGNKEQLAVAAFARALLVIPKTLAVNGAFDATELISKLRAYHNSSQTNESKKDFKYTGLDLETGKVRNNLKAGVLEPAMSKVNTRECIMCVFLACLCLYSRVVLIPHSCITLSPRIAAEEHSLRD
jgi:T-complex protein 1 subunit alpha